jgi:hypothetical protein
MSKILAYSATFLSILMAFRATAIGHVTGGGADDSNPYRMIRCERLLAGADLSKVNRYALSGLLKLNNSAIYSIRSDLTPDALKILGLTANDLPIEGQEGSKEERTGNPNSLKFEVIHNELRIVRTNGAITVFFPFSVPPSNPRAWENLYVSDHQLEKMKTSIGTRARRSGEPVKIEERSSATEFRLILRDNGSERVILKVRNPRAPFLYELCLDVACETLETYVHHPELRNADYLRNSMGSHILMDRGFLCRIPVLGAISP